MVAGFIEVGWDKLQVCYLAHLQVLRLDGQLLREWAVVKGELLVVAAGLRIARWQQNQVFLEGGQ